MTLAAEAARIRLDFTAGMRDAMVEGDRGRLRQVVMILLDKAIRHSRPGRAVALSLSPRPDFLVLRVVDDSIGIEGRPSLGTTVNVTLPASLPSPAVP